ncbi:MAG: hypothetical protein WD991_02390 [Candidatus Paceibacterota bacterium]
MILEELIFFLYRAAIYILPLFGTIFLGWVAFKLWVHYIRQDFISGIEFILLEIIPPREVLRSPKAMELFFTNALYHWSNKGGKEEYWQGAVWFWFSLEIASIDGQVHFYLRTPSRLRSLIETQMYAQYPQAHVKVVEDYTLAVDHISDHSAWRAWGCEFGLAKPEAYPIKTYTDFGLDKDPKEEFKVDPISPIIELFGSLQKGEQAWVQIVITPSKKAYKTPGKWFTWHDWVTQADMEIKKMLEPYTKYSERPSHPGEMSREVRVPKYMDDLVDGMSTKVTKLGFETGIRLVYVAKRESFNMNTRRNIRLIFRQYAKPNSNEFVRMNSSQGDAYGGTFTLPDHKVTKLTARVVHEYQERSFYHVPLRHHLFSEHALWMHWPISRFFLAYKHHQTFVLNVEELATLWHFPGQILKVPTLERIESKEASPPTNLPI